MIIKWQAISIKNYKKKAENENPRILADVSILWETEHETEEKL